MGIAERFKRLAWWFTKGLAIKATLFEGKLHHSETNLRCWMVGDTGFPADFRARVFAADPRVVKVVRLPFFYLGPYLQKHADTYDLGIAALPPHRSSILNGYSRFAGPNLITQWLDTSGGWDQVLSNMARAKRSWIKRFQKQPDLELRISRSEDDLLFFYDRMLVPYVKQRFGGLADVDSLTRIRKIFQDDGLLIFASQNGKPIAASLCQVGKGVLSYNRAGVLDGDERLLQTGALTAIYLEQVQYAIKLGLPLLDLKQSRPFLKDGVFDNKARWGARVVPYEQASSTIHYLFGRPSAARAMALERCPVIVNDGAQLSALIGHTGSDKPCSDALQQCVRQYYLQGLNRALVATPEQLFVVEPEMPAKPLVESGRKHFYQLPYFRIFAAGARNKRAVGVT